MNEFPEVAQLALKIGGLLVGLGITLAGVREALRLGKAAHRRLDHIEDRLTQSEKERARNDGIVTTKLDGITHELDRARQAIHDTRNEIGGRLMRIEDRLDTMKSHA